MYQVYRNIVDDLNEEHVSSESECCRSILWGHFFPVLCGLFIVGSSMVNPP